jgi:hypothetical protein
MTTAARLKALQWFYDHEVGGPNAVFDRRPPSTKMRRLMAKEGEVIKLPIGQFEYFQWRLTPHGREVLGTRPKRRRKLKPADAATTEAKP